MGYYIENNDTLQITREQGFPAELIYEKHCEKPFTAADFKDQIFEFKDKPGIRMFPRPPVRTFLVENRDGKWLYWGLAHIIEVKYDMVNGATSGKFKITYINTPEEIKKAHELIDRNPETDFFGDKNE